MANHYPEKNFGRFEVGFGAPPKRQNFLASEKSRGGVFTQGGGFYPELECNMFLMDFLPLWCSLSTTDLMSTGLNTTECAQLQRMEQDQIKLGCICSALVTTFPTDTSLLCIICVVFSSAAPAALHFTTICPERRLRRPTFFSCRRSLRRR